MTFLAESPIIYLITPGEATAENFPEKKAVIVETVRSAAADGVSMFQVREKKLPARLLYELARAVREEVSPTAGKLLINDRIDVALAAGADGVHLPSEGIPAAVLRRRLPKSFVVGVSAHTLDDVLAARRAGADFAAFAPVFYTPGKAEPAGIEELRRVCGAAAGFPVLALGGIDESNFESTIRAGAAGFAAIRALNDVDSRSRIVSSLKAAFPRR